MIHYVLVLAFLLSVGGLAAAQAPPAPRYFGLFAGVNRATLGGGDAEGWESRTGLLLGASLYFRVAPFFAVQPELSFSMKGAELSDATGTGSLKMNFLDLAVPVRYDVPVAGSVRPFLYAGPFVGYRLTCDVSGSSGGTTVSYTCFEFDDQFFGGDTEWGLVDFGVVGGGGLAFDVGGRTMTLGGRYAYGMYSVTSEADEKHRVVSFLASFEWPFGRIR